MRPEKADIVADLSQKLNASSFMLVTDYQKMKVPQFSELRNRLAPSGAEVHVVKNSFLKRAMATSGLPDVGEQLAELGLRLSEAKRLTAAIQAEIVPAQVTIAGEHGCTCAACGRRLASKGHYSATFRSRRWCTWWVEGEMTPAPSHYATPG